jgi:hypothetical protein
VRCGAVNATSAPSSPSVIEIAIGDVVVRVSPPEAIVKQFNLTTLPVTATVLNVGQSAGLASPGRVEYRCRIADDAPPELIAGDPTQFSQDLDAIGASDDVGVGGVQRDGLVGVEDE